MADDDAKATRKKAVKKAATKKAPVRQAESAPKTTAKKAPAPRKTAAKKAAGGPVTPEQRYLMIQEAAYYRAQQRNFEPGHEWDDWIASEAEVDAKLKG